MRISLGDQVFILIVLTLLRNQCSQIPFQLRTGLHCIYCEYLLAQIFYRIGMDICIFLNENLPNFRDFEFSLSIRPMLCCQLFIVYSVQICISVIPDEITDKQRQRVFIHSVRRKRILVKQRIHAAAFSGF